ncbi:MAG: CHAT domain-containing protein [Chloroflexi bacterium]|nr:CHAT domain-containing protein [Chloroflexota bacterium]
MRNRHAEASACFRSAAPALRRAGLWLEAARCLRDWAVLLNVQQKYDQMARKLTSARTVFHAQDSAVDLALCDLVEGAALIPQGDFPEAAQLLVAGAGVLQEHEVLPDAARATWLAGQVAYHQGRYEQALELFNLTVVRFRRMGLDFREAMGLGDRGLALWGLGQLEQAGQAFREAIAVLERLHPGAYIGETNRYNLGVVLLESGRLAAAEKEFKRALEGFRELEDRRWIANCLAGLAETALTRGELAESLRLFQLACALFRKARDRAFEGVAMRRMAEVCAELNQFDRARSLLLAALAQARRDGNPYRLASALLLLAGAESALCERDMASERYAEAEQVARSADLPQLVARCQLHQAQAMVDTGDLAGAEALARAARDTFAEREYLLWQARCDLLEAHCQRLRGQFESARAGFLAVLSGPGTLVPELAALAHLGLGLIAEAENNPSDARAHVTQGILAQRRTRRSLRQAELMAGYQAHHVQLFDLGRRLALADSREVSWLLWLEEEQRAQSLLIRLASPAAPSASPAERRQQKKVETLEARMRALQAIVDENPSSFRRGAIVWRQRREQARVKLGQVQQQFNDAYHNMAGLRHNGHSGGEGGEFELDCFCRQVAGHLPQDWQALIYHWSGDRPTILCLSAAGLLAISQPEPDPELAALVWALRPGEMPDGADSARALARLSPWLLPPALAESLHPDRLLLILPSGPLAYLPFAALPLGENGLHLVERATLCCAPSLQVLAALAARQPATAQSGRVLGVGYAGGRNASISRLRRVADEMEVLRQEHGGNLTLLDADRATVAELRRLDRRGRLRGFECLHFTAHGGFDREFQRASGLQLADEILSAYTIAGFRLAARAVILNVCQGAAREVLPGDEWVGLVTALLGAGAQSVVGDLWPLPDQAGPFIARGLHRALKHGGNLASGLAQVQREQIRLGQPLRAWAGMSAIGLP